MVSKAGIALKPGVDFQVNRVKRSVHFQVPLFPPFPWKPFFQANPCLDRLMTRQAQTTILQKPESTTAVFWLVVSTHLKNISQIGHLPQIGGERKKCLKPPPSFFVCENPLKINMEPSLNLKNPTKIEQEYCTYTLPNSKPPVFGLRCEFSQVKQLDGLGLVVFFFVLCNF